MVRSGRIAGQKTRQKGRDREERPQIPKRQWEKDKSRKIANNLPAFGVVSKKD